MNSEDLTRSTSFALVKQAYVAAGAAGQEHSPSSYIKLTEVFERCYDRYEWL